MRTETKNRLFLVGCLLLLAWWLVRAQIEECAERHGKLRMVGGRFFVCESGKP